MREVEIMHEGQLYVAFLNGSTVYQIVKWCIVEECEIPMGDKEYLRVAELFSEMGYSLE